MTSTHEKWFTSIKKKKYPGKETYIHGKRHTSMRRDLLPWKETCIHLNKKHITYIRENRPHIHIKYISHTYHTHITHISHTYHIPITYKSQTCTAYSTNMTYHLYPWEQTCENRPMWMKRNLCPWKEILAHERRPSSMKRDPQERYENTGRAMYFINIPEEAAAYVCVYKCIYMYVFMCI